MRKTLLKITLYGCLGIALLLSQTTAHAEDKTDGANQIPKTFNVTNMLKAKDQDQSYFKDTENAPLISFALQVLNFLARVIATVGVVAMIVGGIIMITASGSDTQVSKGKDIFKYALIGLIFAFMSYIITTFVQTFFT